MSMSNAERQKRYRERMHAAARQWNAISATWTTADIIPTDHPNDTHPPIALIRALSGPTVPEPPLVEFVALADVPGWIVEVR